MKWFAEMGILVGAEIEVNNDLVHGRCDALISDGEQNYVVEIKSCSQWTFQKLVKPSSSHYLQLQFYLYYININKGILLYECKDNQSIKTFYVESDRLLVEKYIEELKKLKEMINKGEEPSDEPLLLENLEYGI
jgi:CRISPR/Cas system-associated exonuclease Cas4 (RecB family)